MKKSFLFCFCLLWVGTFLAAQESRYLYIKKIIVNAKNAEGKSWDPAGNLPDVKVTVAVRSGQDWKPVFSSVVMKDKSSVTSVLATNAQITLGDEMKIEIVDQDDARYETIGSHSFQVQAVDFESVEKEMTFGEVKTFICFFCKYKTLDLNSKQQSHVRNAELNIGTAERYLASPYTASSAVRHIEKAEKDLVALQAEIPDHPKVKELTAKFRQFAEGLVEGKVQEVVKKISRLQEGYEFALTSKDEAKAAKTLEDIKALLVELKKYQESKAGKEEYSKNTEWIALKEKEAKEVATQPAWSEDQERKARYIENHIFSAERQLESSYTASYAANYIEKAKQDLAALAKEIPSHPRIQELEAKIKKLDERMEECKLELLLASVKRSMDHYASAEERNATPRELERYVKDLESLMPELEKVQNTQAGKEAYSNAQKWLVEKSAQLQAEEKPENPVVTKVEDKKPPVVTKVEDKKPPVVTKAEDKKPPVVTKVEDKKPPVVTKAEDKTKPTTPRKYTEKKAKEADARLYSTICYAKGYQERCIDAKQRLDEKLDYSDVTAPQSALRQFLKCLADGKQFVEIVSTYPEEYDEHLKTYAVFVEFGKTYQESLKVPTKKAWENLVGRSNRYFKEAMERWQENMKNYQDQVSDDEDPVQSTSHVKNLLTNDGNDAERQLENWQKKAKDDKENMDSCGFSLLADVQIEKHPEIVKAKRELQEGREQFARVVEEMLAFAVIKRYNNRIQQARMFLERGNQSKDENDLKRGMAEYDEILQYLNQHIEKKGIPELVEKVKQEQSSDEFKKAQGHFSQKDELIAKAQLVFNVFLKKKQWIEKNREGMPGPELRKHLQEAKDILKPAVPYTNIDEVSRDYKSHWSWIAGEEFYLGEREEEERIAAILAKVDPSKVNLMQSINTKFGNSLREWILVCDKGKGKMDTKWGNQWDSWLIELPQGKATVETKSGNSMREWKYKSDDNAITIETKWGNKWDTWIVKDIHGNRLVVSAKYGNHFREWVVSGLKGRMNVYLKYNNQIDQWVVKDEMPEENIHLKLAAIFPCILTATDIVSK